MVFDNRSGPLALRNSAQDIAERLKVAKELGYTTVASMLGRAEYIFGAYVLRSSNKLPMLALVDARSFSFNAGAKGPRDWLCYEIYENQRKRIRALFRNQVSFRRPRPIDKVIAEAEAELR